MTEHPTHRRRLREGTLDRPAVVRQPRRHLEVTSGGAWRCHLDHGDDVAEAARG